MALKSAGLLQLDKLGSLTSSGMSEFLLKLKLEPFYITKAYKSNLTAGEKCTKGHLGVSRFWLWNLEAGPGSVNARPWSVRPLLPLTL